MIRARLRFSDRGIALAALAALTVSVVFAATGSFLPSPPKGPSEIMLFGAFALLVAASEMFEVTLPNNVSFSLGIAPAIGFALLGSVGLGAGQKPLPEILTMFAVGMLIASAMRASMRKPLQLIDAATHFLALAAGSAVYLTFTKLGGLWFNTCAHKMPDGGCPPLIGAPYVKILVGIRHIIIPWNLHDGFTDLSVLGLLAMLLVILIVETTLNTLRTVDRERIPFAPVFIGGIRSTGALHLSIMSVGALLAIAYPPLQQWSFPLFLAPLAATQFAFRQFASIRKTYLQTIAALSRVPEMAGYTQPGHSKRVAELSVEIARELGVNEQAITEIEYAALLHDIGRVSIPDPADAANASHLELALTGSGIVRETGHFPRVADMIEKQYEPYRRRGEDANPDLLLGAKIIKVASGYDDLARPGSAVALSTWDVLERLHLGMAYEYDPQVIQALTRVLEKRGEA